MRVRILGTTDDGGLQFAIAHPLPRLPEIVVVYPDAAERRFATVPEGHALSQTRGDHGFLKDVRAVARSYLLGYLLRGTAEVRLERALAGWSEQGATP